MWFKGFLCSICELTGFYISKKTKVIVPSHMIVRAQSSVARKLDKNYAEEEKAYASTYDVLSSALFLITQLLCNHVNFTEFTCFKIGSM